MNELLQWMLGIPRGLTYVMLGVGAALENVFPAVPADTFVALGGLLSALGNLDARIVFLATWLSNVGSALVMYRLGYTHGRPFFQHGFGRHLLAPRQMERMEAFYHRWGLFALFFTRFLPGLRSIVPIFAGVTLNGFVPVAIPLTVASGIWYGGLVWLGVVTGRNLDLLTSLLDRMGLVLGLGAAVLLIAIGAWWWRTRGSPDA
jgi:membrane protein DedA with SNARE-associated domain